MVDVVRRLDHRGVSDAEMWVRDGFERWNVEYMLVY